MSLDLTPSPDPISSSTPATGERRSCRKKKMADVYCACIIANAEGLKLIPLPADGELKLSLESLDARARRIEARSFITPPPPMLEASWDSLTWRVCRLARLRGGRKMLKKTPPISDIVSMPFLRSLLATMDGQRPFTWPEKEDVEDKEFLGKVAQWLCHFAGQRTYQVDNIAFELKSIVSLAIDLSLETESVSPLARGPVYAPPPQRFPQTCNCCAVCRGPLRRVPSVSSLASSRSGRGKCSKWFGWVKKLAFWRKKRVTDDDASSSTGTLADD
ncbi:hypothetical protein F4821DRAFT_30431 [Hypoxylon rubiginosum]|uniref:Uncharacterized protein n=1 Tax=Hypoxylon rubiginosum TaxID=110542 RepID=A0ACC0DCV2_9PEZI|nr:hypothetical protein F4821DRAFT_30431 [Hypoxylon rubiginosum]